MRHVGLLAAVYALVVALVMPGALLAQEDTAPPAEGTSTVEEAPPPPPAPREEQPPAPEVPPPAPEPAPEPAAATPEPQVLGDERDEKPKAVAAADGGVTIVDYSFSPGTITINVGDTVTWTNDGPTPHSATAPNGAFDTGIFPAGESRSHTFSQAGTFSYICTPHPNMRGTVVVQGAQTGGGDTPDSSDGGTAGSADTGTTGEAAQADGGPTLPNSGAEAGALFILGGLLLLLGLAVHRRVHPE